MRTHPHICILTSQYFDWGIYGGFGSMSRKLAESLVRSGHRVSVIVPGRQGQQPTETIGGVEIRSFSPRNVAAACRLIRESRADIFHSQDPTVLTYLAQRLQPKRAHLVTSRDPRELSDWWVEFLYATPMRRLLTPLNYLTESGLLVRRAVRRADAVFLSGPFPEGEGQAPLWPVGVADAAAQSHRCSRDAAPKKCPPHHYVCRAVGQAQTSGAVSGVGGTVSRVPVCGGGSGGVRRAESGFDAQLRRKFRDVPNLEMPGLINRFREPERMHQILSDTWVFVSTAVREGLPLTFLEAAAYGCPIISRVDPDQFASRFGRQVHDDDYASAIRTLLAESPLEKGRAAYDYVRETYETSTALAAHQAQYERFAA